VEMIIHYVKVEGLLGRNGTVYADFHEDLNIITGRNGAGKTTFLKLCWYLISGSISQALSEISFDTVELKTSKYHLILKKISSNTCKAEFTDSSGHTQYMEDIYEDADHGFVQIDARDSVSEAVAPLANSLFFPTFRRIEGGYSMPGSKRSRPGLVNRESRELEEAMANLARRMSNADHTFISSISTIDIEALLLKNYADLSEKYNGLQRDISGEIIETIRGFEEESLSQSTPEHGDIKSARDVIYQVRAKIEFMEAERVSIMSPMSAIQNTVTRLFQHSGIQFGARLSFGEAASAVRSDALSAGEKQMLSFICYNAFRKECLTFIDEPELSLHVDWQRNLFPTLLEQNSSNQFIIATHSPFIYSKYPDKEICIDLDSMRGDEHGGVHF
jgi:predicted ATPase